MALLSYNRRRQATSYPSVGHKTTTSVVMTFRAQEEGISRHRNGHNELDGATTLQMQPRRPANGASQVPAKLDTDAAQSAEANHAVTDNPLFLFKFPRAFVNHT
jgi:hypothetical protein